MMFSTSSPDVPGLGERRRVRDHEGDVEKPRERLCQQRLARPRRPDQQDVALRELDLVVLAAGLQPLVVVVDSDRQDLLREILADDVLVEDLPDLVRRWAACSCPSAPPPRSCLPRG